ncbi:hypothetical protein WG909_07455 [Peptostreptococcaceae bacterium AGR-M142]
MKKNKFLGTNKPDYSDLADIQILNKNTDLIENQFKKIDKEKNSMINHKISLNSKEIKSIIPTISTLINPIFKGDFRQNLIDTNKCIYRVNGDDYSPMPTDITDNSIKIMSYSSRFIGTGCYLGVIPGQTYTIKAESIEETYITIYNANGLTTSNYTTKRMILKGSKNHNFKFIAPTGGYIFISLDKKGSDPNGTIMKNLICIEGDYVDQSIEWFKGIEPVYPKLYIHGDNLFDGKWDIIDKELELRQKSVREFSIKGIGNKNFDENLFPTIKFKKNTQYTFVGKCVQDIEKNTTLLIRYTDGTSDNIYKPTTIEKPFLRISGKGKTIEKIYYSYSSAGGTTTIKNFMILEGTERPVEYILPKYSEFKINNWLGYEENYENGLINKTWDRMLLSEWYNSKIGIDIGVILNNNYIVKIKRSEFRGFKITQWIPIKFKDFINYYSDAIDFKYIANGYNTKLGYDYIVLSIPKIEIDNQIGTSLTEKFESWILENDDYIYYKKSKNQIISADINSIAGIFGNESNTILNESFGECMFNYGESINSALLDIVCALKLNESYKKDKNLKDIQSAIGLIPRLSQESSNRDIIDKINKMMIIIEGRI